MSEKRDLSAGSVSCFVCSLQSPEKSIYISEYYQPRNQDFAERGDPKANFFAQICLI